MLWFDSNWQLPVEVNEGSLDRPGSVAPGRLIWQCPSTFLTIKAASVHESGAAHMSGTYTIIFVVRPDKHKYLVPDPEPL